MSDTIVTVQPQLQTVSTLAQQVVLVDATRVQVVTSGMQGPAGPGLPTGGSSGQLLKKNSSTNFDTVWGNVDLASSSLTGYLPGYRVSATNENGQILFWGESVIASDAVFQRYLSGSNGVAIYDPFGDAFGNSLVIGSNYNSLNQPPLGLYQAATGEAWIQFYDSGNNLAAFISDENVSVPKALVDVDQIFSRKLTGGTASNSTLTFQTTDNNGITGSDFIWLNGNSGGTTAMKLLNSGSLLIGTTTDTSRLTVLGGSNNATAYFYNNNGSGKTRVTIRAGSGNSNTGTSEPVLSIQNSSGTQTALIRGDGLIASTFVETVDDITATMVDSTAETSNYPRGINLGSGAMIGWGSNQWWSAKDVRLARIASNVLGVCTTSNSTPDGELRAGKLTASSGLYIKEGTNATMGTATLNGTTAVTISTTKVTANSRIFLTIQAPGGTPASAYVNSRTAGTSFTVKSTGASDTSTVAWVIIEPS